MHTDGSTDEEQTDPQVLRLWRSRLGSNTTSQKRDVGHPALGAGCGRSEVGSGTRVVRASRSEAPMESELRSCELSASDAGEAEQAGAEEEQARGLGGGGDRAAYQWVVVVNLHARIKDIV